MSCEFLILVFSSKLCRMFRQLINFAGRVTIVRVSGWVASWGVLRAGGKQLPQKVRRQKR